MHIIQHFLYYTSVELKLCNKQITSCTKKNASHQIGVQQSSPSTQYIIFNALTVDISWTFQSYTKLNKRTNPERNRKKK